MPDEIHPTVDQTDTEGMVDALDTSVTLYDILEDTLKARIYTAVLVEGPMTRQAVTDAIDGYGETKIWEELDQLSSTEYLHKHDDDQPYEYTADPMEKRVMGEEDQGVLVTPTFIALVSARSTRDDIDTFLSRHSLGRLAAALWLTVGYLNGEYTRRMVADELGVEPYEGIMITQAIEEVIEAVGAADPVIDAVLSEK